MTNHVSSSRSPTRSSVDGELVAFDDKGAPHWPLLCERVLHGTRSIRVTSVAFDVLRVRRALLEELGVERRACA
ncbi:MAG TPA: hypothetical protein VFO26_10290 [Gaiella sp.]|uniref:hypothetical protein n=1 Tax=Gaiella sp. TaxID=2663207 RepID=UPI002D810E42|nr:hypothetical protein [Gaiella sp.]HET9287937.1 hypothetical protein [Gaiella sp.]